MEKTGYGQVGVTRLIGMGLLPPDTCRVTYAHRVAFMLANGRWLTPDEHIDHECHDSAVCKLRTRCLHRRCIDPVHLKATTQDENNRRAGWYDGNPRNGWQGRETCGNGHRYDENNNLVWLTDRKGNRYRGCRQCNRDWAREYRLTR